MPKCGVCGDHYGELMVKHAELCEDDSKALSVRYAPEKTINDLIRERDYLTKCIRYELGREEREGLMEFAKRSGIREVS